MYIVRFYVDGRGCAPVRDFIRGVNKKSKAKIGRYIDLLEQHGPDLPRPYADHVKDKIRELRVSLEDGNVRIFYFFFVDKNIVLLHAFKKKTQELPVREVEQAENNMDNFLDQYKQGKIQL